MTQTDRGRPGGHGTPSTLTSEVMTRVPAAWVEQCAVRAVQEALQRATAAFWERRAQEFEAAMSVPGEYHGQATRQEIRERDQRAADAALACRRAAQLALVPVDVFDPELVEILEEVDAA